MRVLFKASTKDLQISGGRQELVELGEAFRSVQGEYALEADGDASPYDGALIRLEIALSSDESIRISVDWLSLTLEISGGRQNMGTLGGSIAEFGSVAVGLDHLHLEAWPDDDYFSADSNPLVVALEP